MKSGTRERVRNGYGFRQRYRYILVQRTRFMLAIECSLAHTPHQYYPVLFPTTDNDNLVTCPAAAAQHCNPLQ